ncbi:MAG TPA: P1 family peptidase [Opitutaceae bacterium]|nr:P1 family peptidase [Opitutaceae bacterium]
MRAIVVLALLLVTCVAHGGSVARELGVLFDGAPGPLNAITDVAGVSVGHVTLIEGDDVRTGVTAILPRSCVGMDPVFAAVHVFNGNGEMTGTHWIAESGFLEGPVMLTNTHSVGAVSEGVIAWSLKNWSSPISLPVVAETWDGLLNDINGFHVRPAHAAAALDAATAGPVAEGNVGGGTGNRAFDFKAGIGTSSRVVEIAGQRYTVGVLVQANFGRRAQLTIAGKRVGREITDLMPEIRSPPAGEGSMIAVVATNAPLLPHQLARLAKRVPLGMARTGATSLNSSGDFAIAFSTVRRNDVEGAPLHETRFVDNARLDPLLGAVVEATEEAILNSLLTAESMPGRAGSTIHALPHDRLRAALGK